MYPQRYFVIIALGFYLFPCQSCRALNSNFRLETGIYQGEATYQIGGIVKTSNGDSVLHFPISELKFPVSLRIGTIYYDLKINQQANLNINLSRDLVGGGGKLADSDWLRPSSGQADIFSESDLNSGYFEAGIQWLYKIGTVIYPKNIRREFYAGLGYLHQGLAFTASNLVQSFPSDPSRDSETVGGKVLNYQMIEDIPFWSFGLKQNIGRGILSAEFKNAPNLKISDKDDHLLRAKLAEGELTGSATIFNIGLEYPFNGRLAGYIKYNYQQIEASGKQTQTRYKETNEGPAGTIAVLDEKISNDRSSFVYGFEYHPFDSPPATSEAGEIMAFKSHSILKRVIGFSFLYPFSERNGSGGLHLELETKRFIGWLSFYNGNNKVQTLSLGNYSMTPIYGLFKLPFGGRFSLLAGGGYSFNENKIDPQAISVLATKGYKNARETISSAPILMVGLSAEDPYGDGKISYDLRYCYQRPSVIFTSDEYQNSRELDLNSLELAIRLAI